MRQEDTEEVEAVPMATVRLFGGGRITIPKPVRESLNLEDGDVVVAKLSKVKDD
jgi:AbrB family looped-hinge helix DNA binding protein